MLEVTVESQSNTGPGGPALGQAGYGLLSDRSCGACSLCCKVLPVEELNKAAGQWCVHVVPRSGCAIYADRPEACRHFFCSWRRDPNLGPEWKPDVARFVLSEDAGRRALVVTVDPGMPLAWKREPYFSRLKQVSELAFPQGYKVVVSVRGHITVVLPDREVVVGAIGPADDIAIWREGSTYGARLGRAPGETGAAISAAVATRPAPSAPHHTEAQGEASPAYDPAFLDSVFKQAFEKTCQLLDDPRVDDLQALDWTLEGRNRVLDETAASFAEAASAECRTGCISCCYLMVSGTPLEILSIARRILETSSPSAVESLKARLQRVAEIPLDPSLRARARIPCALLENGLCSVYAQRPSTCRMMLSQSRAACDACLQQAGGSIPYIEQPSKVAGAMQMGIDYALISRRNLSTEKSELSRALLIALGDYQGSLAAWLDGKDPFAGAHFGLPAAASKGAAATATAQRLGLA